MANKAQPGKLLINHFQHAIWALPFHENAIWNTLGTQMSRLHLSEVDDTHEAFDAQVHLVVTNLPVSDQEMSDLQASTACDPNMQQLIAVIKEGWPDHRNRAHHQ